MSDELFFLRVLTLVVCAQGEPVVDLVAGRQIFAVNFFLAWDRPSVDETTVLLWEFDKELRFSLVDDEVHITGLVSFHGGWLPGSVFGPRTGVRRVTPVRRSCLTVRSRAFWSWCGPCCTTGS